ncbi:MAG TPA: hypothetical protein VIP28_10355 [Nocardioides sp.]
MNLTDQQPEVTVSVTRYTVSVLPAADINHKYFALYVELKSGGWVVHSGHEFYAEDGTWQPSEWRAHRFADYDDALAFARETAPEMTVNGHTATEVWQRARAEAELKATGAPVAAEHGAQAPAGHPTPDRPSETDEETHVVADDSSDPEHIDDCPGCASPA